MSHRDFPTWEHPDLGHFECNGSWSQTEEGRFNHRFRFTIDCSGDDGEPRGVAPPPEQVELACRLFEMRETLIKLTAEALWEDFHGRGPDTGMWWRNEFNDITDSLSFHSIESPRSPSDLEKCLNFAAVYFSEDDLGESPLLAQIVFSAVFEDEHGVGALTDGQQILGLGYGEQATRFPQDKAVCQNPAPKKTEPSQPPIVSSYWCVADMPRRSDMLEPIGPGPTLEALKLRLKQPDPILPSGPKIMVKIMKRDLEKRRRKSQNLLSEVEGESPAKIKACRRIMNAARMSLSDWLPYICHHHGLQAGVEVYLREIETWRERAAASQDGNISAPSGMDAIKTLRLLASRAEESDYQSVLDGFDRRFLSRIPEVRAALYYIFEKDSWRDQLIEDFSQKDPFLRPFRRMLFAIEQALVFLEE